MSSPSPVAPPFDLTGRLLLNERLHVPAAQRRGDRHALAAGWVEAKVIILTGHESVQVDPETGWLALLDARSIAPQPPEKAVYLGQLTGTSTDLWAHYLPQAEPTIRLRSQGNTLQPGAAGSAAVAWAVYNWHFLGPHSPLTGEARTLRPGGWSAVSGSGDGRVEEFPRTDPAVICLIHDGAEHVLLGRNQQWPAGRFSVFAGFIDAGESLESALHREIAEETGLQVDEVFYLGSQPWPFPRSLMFGCCARADRAQQICPQDGEILETQWVHYEQLGRYLRGEDSSVALPGSLSIARALLEAWYDSCNRPYVRKRVD